MSARDSGRASEDDGATALVEGGVEEPAADGVRLSQGLTGAGSLLATRTGGGVLSKCGFTGDKGGLSLSAVSESPE